MIGSMNEINQPEWIMIESADPDCVGDGHGVNDFAKLFGAKQPATAIHESYFKWETIEQLDPTIFGNN